MRNKTLIVRWLKIVMLSIPYGVSLYPYAPFWIHLAGISLFLGFATWLGGGLVINALQNRKDARLIKAALAGQMFRDGQPRAVLGKIYPLETPVLAPFSQKECALLSYDIYQQYWTKRKTHDSSSTVAEPISYSGYHLVPSEIQTSHERVKVIGFPELLDVPEKETTSYGRIESFIEQTDFTEPIGGFIEGVNELSKTIPVDENGAASEDFRFRQPVPEQSLKSREKAIEKGTEVCLIGKFDSAKGGIVPDNRPFGQTMKLIPGTEDQVLSKLTKDSGIVIAFGFIVAVLCISVGLLPHAPDSLLERIPAGEKLIQYRNSVRPPQNKVPDNIKRERKPPVSKKVEQKQVQPAADGATVNVALLIQNGDIEGLRKELEKGLDPDIQMPKPNGYTLPFIEALLYNHIEMAGLLLEFGADINAVNSHMFNGLDTAITYRNIEMVRFLLEAGAEIYAGDAQRLAPLNRAILNQDAETVALLLEAGADPSPPGSEQYLARVPADSEKGSRIRELLNQARGKSK